MRQGKPERDKKWVGVEWGVEGELGGGQGGHNFPNPEIRTHNFTTQSCLFV